MITKTPMTVVFKSGKQIVGIVSFVVLCNGHCHSSCFPEIWSETQDADFPNDCLARTSNVS